MFRLFKFDREFTWNFLTWLSETATECLVGFQTKAFRFHCNAVAHPVTLPDIFDFLAVTVGTQNFSEEKLAHLEISEEPRFRRISRRSL